MDQRPTNDFKFDYLNYKLLYLKLIYFLFSQIGRLEDMTQAVRRIVEIKAGEIDEEQRQLLATAYKTRITPHRNNLRLLQQMQQVNGDDGEESFSEMQQNVINGCKTQIEEELKEIYGEVFVSDFWIIL